MPALVLFEPDIAPNAGTMLRLAACVGWDVHVIEPCGFPWDDRKFKRAGMDYLDQVNCHKHFSWQAFVEWKNNMAGNARIVLLSTRAEKIYWHESYQKNDFIMVGRETAGVPDEVFLAVDLAVKIPMQKEVRSLNVAIAAAMVVGEVQRQQMIYP
jgi:tRNA (cytidine/uridine-2'-O-)-methyltransferase